MSDEDLDRRVEGATLTFDMINKAMAKQLEKDRAAGKPDPKLYKATEDGLVEITPENIREHFPEMCDE